MGRQDTCDRKSRLRLVGQGVRSEKVGDQYDVKTDSGTVRGIEGCSLPSSSRAEREVLASATLG